MIFHMDAILTAGLAFQLLIGYAIVRSRRRTRESNSKMRHALKVWVRQGEYAR